MGLKKNPNKMPQKIFIKTFGCQMNEYDSNRIYDSVKKIGFEKTNNYEDANCYLLNTCHIRDKAKEKVYHEIGRVKKIFRSKQKPLVIIAGCVAQAENQEMLRREPYIDLVVGKEDLNSQSRAEVPSEYDRTSNLGSIEASLLFDFSSFGDYITDIDYFKDMETYFFVGHQKSTIYTLDPESKEIIPLLDLSNYIGTTENCETGLLSINPIKLEDNKLYFLAGYTDKEIRVSISIFSYDYDLDLINKEKELFLSPQNSNLDWLNCGNIERFNDNTWIFCVGDQDSLYALNETSLRTDLYSGKLIMFSLSESFEVLPVRTPVYDPEIFSPVGGDVRPQSVLSTPGIKSKFEIEHILALGFRNPWGFAVGDGYIFAPDVGLNKVEEINFIDLNSLEPKFFGWPHKEGEFYYAKDEIGKFWDYEVKPIYSHASVDNRCANIGGAIHKSNSLPGWNEYFFFLDQCTSEIFIINKSGEKVFRTQSTSISSAPVVVKNDKFGNIIISTYTGQIFLLDLESLDF